MNIQDTVAPGEYREGKVAKTIEKQTSKLSSDLFMWGAFGAMAASLITQFTQPKRMTFLNLPSRSGQVALFIGQWVPTMLLFGLYNKIVKVAGSDRLENQVGSIH